MEQGWVVEGFSIGIPSGYHYRVTRTDDPLTFAKIPAEDRAVTPPQEPEIEAVRKELLCQRSPRCPWDDHAKPYCVNCVARAMLSDFAALTHAIEALRGEMEQTVQARCMVHISTIQKWAAILKEWEGR